MQPVQPFVKFDIFWAFLRFGDSVGGWCQISPLFHEDDQGDQGDQINSLIILPGWWQRRVCRSFYREGVPGDGLPNLRCARGATSAISPEGWKEKCAQGRWLQGMDVRTGARCGQPGPAQHRSSHTQGLAPLWCAVSQVVKTAQSRGRTERTLLSAGTLVGRSCGQA